MTHIVRHKNGPCDKYRCTDSLTPSYCLRMYKNARQTSPRMYKGLRMYNLRMYKNGCQTSPTIIHNSGGAACSIKRAGQLPINQRVGYFFAQKSEAVEKHKNNFPDSNKFQLNPVKLVWQQRRGYREAFLKPPEEMIETFSGDWLFQKLTKKVGG